MIRHGYRAGANRRNGTIYTVWADMVRRCHNEKHAAYKWYGARGIKVCAKWRKSFPAFLADMGQRPEGLTLERKDKNGNYEPSNCKWASWRDQQRNRRNTKLTIVKARNIVRLVLADNRSKQSVADSYGVSRALIRKILAGKAWPEALHEYRN